MSVSAKSRSAIQRRTSITDRPSAVEERVAGGQHLWDSRQDNVLSPPIRRHDNLVFRVLLGAATCLALFAVVQQARSGIAVDPTSVDAPPPAVFVQAD